MIVAVQALLAAALGWAWWKHRPAEASLPHADTIFLVLVGLSLALALLARVHLGTSFRVDPRPGSSATLVDRGIYGVLRHPMYVAVVLLVLGIMIDAPRPLPLAVGAANLVFYGLKSRYEERLLRARYPEYDAYCRRTFGLFRWRRG